MIQPPHDIFKSQRGCGQVKCVTTHSIRSRCVFIMNPMVRISFRCSERLAAFSTSEAHTSSFRVELPQACHSRVTLAAKLWPYKVGAPAESIGATGPPHPVTSCKRSRQD